MGAYGAAKAALVAMVTNLQMELEGTGVRASIVHPGPTKTAMGWSLPAESIGPALEDWAKWGQARHDYFLRAADLARAITFVAETPTGRLSWSTWKFSPRRPWLTTRTARNSNSVKRAYQDSDFAKRQCGAGHERR